MVYPKFLSGFAEDPFFITQDVRLKEKSSFLQHGNFPGMQDRHRCLQGIKKMTLKLF